MLRQNLAVLRWCQQTIPPADRGPGQKGPHVGCKQHSRQDQARDAQQRLVGRQGELGGKALLPVMPAGEVGKFCVAQDPHGAVFSIIEYAGSTSPPLVTDRNIHR